MGESFKLIHSISTGRLRVRSHLEEVPPYLPHRWGLRKPYLSWKDRTYLESYYFKHFHLQRFPSFRRPPHGGAARSKSGCKRPKCHHPVRELLAHRPYSDGLLLTDSPGPVPGPARPLQAFKATQSPNSLSPQVNGICYIPLHLGL